jgi:hypothetical protein
MPAASKPIQSSARQVKELLAKTGRFLLMSEQYDKLEAVVELAQRINDKLEHGAKMDLTLSDLNAFLRREGIIEELDVKGCVSKVIQFVHSQRERLASYAQAGVDGAQKAIDAEKVLHDLLKLWGMEYQEVENCFAIEAYSASASNGQKRDRDDDGIDSHDKSVAETEGKRQRLKDRSVARETLDGVAETALVVAERLASHGQNRDRDDEGTDFQFKPVAENEGNRQRIKDGSVARETLNGVAETAPVVAETALVVPRRARLVEDLKRLVPANILALEDTNETGSSTDRHALALAEVARILEADSDGSPILLGDTIDKRRQAFRAVVRLLHPDVGLVSADDARAMQALDLSLRSFMKSELSEE